MMRLGKCLAALVASLVFLGCDGFSLDTYWRSGNYRLLAVDDLGQMSLVFPTGNGTGIGIVGPTVFAIGENEKFIVLKVHPSTDEFGGFDRSVTHYFVVERTASPHLADAEKGVRGPFTKAEFDKLAVTQSFPKFTKTLKKLE